MLPSFTENNYLILYGIRGWETNKTSSMSNKWGIWENIKLISNKTYNLQLNHLSNSVKYWSFTLLIMHYFVYRSLCFSLSALWSLCSCLLYAPWLFVCSFGTNLSGGRAFSTERPHWLNSFWLTQLSTYV